MKRPKIAVNLPKSPKSVLSTLLVLAGMASLVAFAGFYGLRWAFLAAVPCLILLGVAVGGE